MKQISVTFAKLPHLFKEKTYFIDLKHDKNTGELIDELKEALYGAESKDYCLVGHNFNLT